MRTRGGIGCGRPAPAHGCMVGELGHAPAFSIKPVAHLNTGTWVHWRTGGNQVLLPGLIALKYVVLAIQLIFMPPESCSVF